MRKISSAKYNNGHSKDWGVESASKEKCIKILAVWPVLEEKTVSAIQDLLNEQ